MILINILGRLGADAETWTNEKGTTFVSMRVAVDDGVKSGERVTTWFSVATDKANISDKLLACLTKGTLVQAYGTESVTTYKDRNGEIQISRKIFADRIRLVSVGKSGDTATATATVTTETRATTTTTTSTPVTEGRITAADMACGTMNPPSVVTTPSMAESTDAIDDLPF